MADTRPSWQKDTPLTPWERLKTALAEKWVALQERFGTTNDDSARPKGVSIRPRIGERKPPQESPRTPAPEAPRVKELEPMVHFPRRGEPPAGKHLVPFLDACREAGRRFPRLIRTIRQAKAEDDQRLAEDMKRLPEYLQWLENRYGVVVNLKRYRNPYLFIPGTTLAFEHFVADTAGEPVVPPPKPWYIRGFTMYAQAWRDFLQYLGQ